MRLDAVRTERNFSPARNVRSITFPSDARRSFVRTNAPPLPGLTCWKSRILKTVPSTSIWLPLRNWFVVTISGSVAAAPHAPGERDPRQRLRRGGQAGEVDADDLQAPVQRIERERVGLLHGVVEDRVALRVRAGWHQHGRGQRDVLGQARREAAVQLRVGRLLAQAPSAV